MDSEEALPTIMSISWLEKQFSKVLSFIEGVDKDEQEGKHLKVIVKCFGLLIMLGVIILSIVAPLWLWVFNKGYFIKGIIVFFTIIWLALYGSFALYVYRRYLKKK